MSRKTVYRTDHAVEYTTNNKKIEIYTDGK